MPAIVARWSQSIDIASITPSLSPHYCNPTSAICMATEVYIYIYDVEIAIRQ